jgi:elongation factor 1-gamma
MCLFFPASFSCAEKLIYEITTVAKQDPNTKLCGSNLNEESTVLRWASFTNYELLPPIMAWINPVFGRSTATPDQITKLEEGCELTVSAIE